MATDKEIITWYKKGWKDELHGSSSLVPDDEELQTAYKHGAIDAIVGDDMPKVDAQTDEEIILNVRK